MGIELAMKGYLFLVSAVYYRSSWKYKNRALRYCLLDAGHLLGSIEASALLKAYTVEMLYNIDREKLNLMFGFEGREWMLSGCSMAVPLKDQKVSAIEFSLPYVDGSRTFEANALIEQGYNETMHMVECKKEVQIPTFIINL